MNWQHLFQSILGWLVVSGLSSSMAAEVINFADNARSCVAHASRGDRGYSIMARSRMARSRGFLPGSMIPS